MHTHSSKTGQFKSRKRGPIRWIGISVDAAAVRVRSVHPRTQRALLVSTVQADVWSVSLAHSRPFIPINHGLTHRSSSASLCGHSLTSFHYDNTPRLKAEVSSGMTVSSVDFFLSELSQPACLTVNPASVSRGCVFAKLHGF